MRAWILTIVVVAGCYAPYDHALGTPCDTACPGALACVDHVCREPGDVTDARSEDAFSIDGPPGDVDADGINDLVDNCQQVANPDQHDEDHDSIGDVCDPCPHLSGDAADADGDGVGDACDPQPTVAKQRIVFFDPFTSVTPAWSGGPTIAVSADQLHIGAGGATNTGGSLAVPSTSVRFAAAGTITNAYPAYPQEVSLSFGENSQGLYHYVQFWNSSTSGGITINRYAGGGSYPQLAGHPYTPPMNTGPWSMQIDISVPNKTIDMVGTYGGAPYPELSASAPTLVGGNKIKLYAHNLSMTFDYVLVIETLP